jgi:hypothetical protein
VGNASPRPLIVLLAAVALAIIVGVTVAPAARASGPADIPTPAGDTDPWQALSKGDYSGTDLSNLVARISGYSGTDGVSIEDLYTGLSTTDSDIFAARIANAARIAGAAPSIDAIALEGGVGMLPIAAGVGAAALIGIGGYLAYKYFLSDSSGTHTVYTSFSKRYLGGATVTVCSTCGSLGTQYKYVTPEQAAADGIPYRYDLGFAPFGWVVHVCGSSACTDSSLTRYGLAANTGKFWSFNYNVSLPYGSPTTSWDINMQGDGMHVGNNMFGEPNFAGCSAANSNLTTCLGGVPFGASAANRNAWAQAATITQEGLNGTLNPLPVHLDTTAQQVGHLFYPQTCINGGATGIGCEAAWTNDTDFERLLPRHVGPTDPGGSIASGVTVTAPDITTPTKRSAITTELGDPCGRAAFDYLIAPQTFPFHGCPQPDPNAPGGSTVPALAPTTPGGSTVPVVGGGTAVPTFKSFVLPPPLAQETYDEYAQRLRELGWLGQLTVEDSPDYPYPANTPATFLPPGSPTQIRVTAPAVATLPVYGTDGLPVPYPSLPPTVSSPDVPITIDKTPGTPAGAGTCTPPSTPALDFTPLNGHSLSDKFPFALLGWLSGFVGSLNVSGVAPTFTVPVGTHDLVVDLSVADPLMAYLRPILAGFTLIGAIVFLATGALGWGARAPDATGE